jgi:hypothetical protein
MTPSMTVMRCRETWTKPLSSFCELCFHTKNKGTDREGLADSHPPKICLLGSPFGGSKPFRELEAERQ